MVIINSICQTPETKTKRKQRFSVTHDGQIVAINIYVVNKREKIVYLMCGKYRDNRKSCQGA